MAQSLLNLGSVYCARQKYTEAEPCLREALGIFESTLGGGDQFTRQTRASLAIARMAQGEFAEAEQLLRADLEWTRKQLGEDHPDTAEDLMRLAVLYGNQGRYAEALPLAERAAAIHRAAPGADQNRTRAFDELVAKVHERIRQKNSAAPATVASGESAVPTNPAPDTGAARSPAVQIPVAAPASSAERTSFEQGAKRVKCRPAQGSLISLLKLARVAYKLFQIPRPSREGRGGGSCPSQRFTPHPALSPRGKRGFEALRLAASPCLTHGAQSAALPAPAPTVVHREFSRAATLAAAPYGSLDCGSGAWLFACPPSRFAGEKGLGDQIR